MSSVAINPPAAQPPKIADCKQPAASWTAAQEDAFKLEFSRKVRLLHEDFANQINDLQHKISSFSTDLNGTVNRILLALGQGPLKAGAEVTKSGYLFSAHEFVDVKYEEDQQQPDQNVATESIDENQIEEELQDDSRDMDDSSDDSDSGDVSPVVESDYKPVAKRRIHRCKVCTDQFPTHRQLTKHMISAHGAEKPYKCDRCPKEFCDRYSFNKHSETPHKVKQTSFVCDICPKTLTSHSGLVIHRRIHTGERPYECDICAQTYSQRQSLTLHMRTHTNDRPYLCHTCSKTFKQRNSFKLHLLSHTDIRPFKCHLCPRAFLQKAKLTIHIQSHTGEKPVICPICSKGYTKRYHVRKHIKKFHKIEDVDRVLGPRKRAYEASRILMYQQDKEAGYNNEQSKDLKPNDMADSGKDKDVKIEEPSKNASLTS